MRFANHRITCLNIFITFTCVSFSYCFQSDNIECINTVLPPFLVHCLLYYQPVLLGLLPLLLLLLCGFNLGLLFVSPFWSR